MWDVEVYEMKYCIFDSFCGILYKSFFMNFMFMMSFHLFKIKGKLFDLNCMYITNWQCKTQLAVLLSC